jgi:hypothetical protein
MRGRSIALIALMGVVSVFSTPLLSQSIKPGQVVYADCGPSFDSVVLLGAPNRADATIRTVLKCGEKITILTQENSNPWYYVRTQDGRQGYISSSFISSSPIQSSVEAPATGTSATTLPDIKPVGKLRLYQPAQAEAVQKLVASQSKMIADLSQRVLELEGRIQSLEQRETEGSSVIGSPKAEKLDLSEVRLQLAGFNSACTSDQDRAVAMAIVENLSVHTYEGAAAMNCAGRLKRIVDDLVRSLDK